MSEESIREQITAQVFATAQKIAQIAHVGQTEEWLSLDVTMPQLKVLAQLYLGGEANMARLASALGVKLPTITGLVDRLVERGLVRREESPHDRRLVLARLTDAGREMMDRLSEAGRLKLGRVLEHASLDDLRLIGQAVEVLHKAVQREYGAARASGDAGGPPSSSGAET